MPQSVEGSNEPEDLGAVVARNVDGDDDDDEPGLLERLIAMERGGEAATIVATRIGDLTEEIGVRFTQHTERLDRAQLTLGTGLRALSWLLSETLHRSKYLRR